MSVAQATEHKTLFTLQVMRASAASMVVFHHFCLAIEQYHHRAPYISQIGRLDFIGASGVDIFFVISGFIIFHTLKERGGPRTAFNFVRHRVIRVIPLYWLWTTIYLGLWMTGFAFRELHVTLDLIFKSYFLIPTFKPGPPPSYHPLLDQGWTLSFEMYFYSITAFIILLNITSRKLIWLSVALGLLFIAATKTALPTAAIQVMGSPMVFEFLAGAALALFMREFGTVVRRRLPDPIPLILIGSGFLIIGMSAFLADPTDYRALIWGPAASLIVFGSVISTWSPRGRFGKVAVFLGAASYSIYLTHGFFTLALGTLLKHNIGQSLPPDLFILVGTIVTIIGCSLSYPLCEQPLLRWLRPRTEILLLPANTHLVTKDQKQIVLPKNQTPTP